MSSRFNPPPGWPTPPEGWEPAADWQPDASWPPAPAGWRFWLDDGFPVFPGRPASVRSSSTGGVSPWLGWAGLVAIALAGLLSGGISSGLVMVGLYVLVVGIVALARGHVGWARIGSRATAGFATGAGLVVLLVGGATAASTTPSGQHTVTAATASTTAAQVLTVGPTPTGTDSAEAADPTPVPVLTTTVAPVAATTRAPAKAKPVVKPKPPVVKKTSAPKPKPTPKPKPKPKPTAASCYPLTNGGNCYEPGEFCRASDHGAPGVAGDGKKIVCRDNDGWRWEPA